MSELKPLAKDAPAKIVILGRCVMSSSATGRSCRAAGWRDANPGATAAHRFQRRGRRQWRVHTPVSRSNTH